MLNQPDADRENLTGHICTAMHVARDATQFAPEPMTSSVKVQGGMPVTEKFIYSVRYARINISEVPRRGDRPARLLNRIRDAFPKRLADGLTQARSWSPGTGTHSKTFAFFQGNGRMVATSRTKTES